MSKRLILYLVTLVAIIAFTMKGVPTLFGTPSYDSQEHVIPGLVSEPVKVSTFLPLAWDNLPAATKDFIKLQNEELGVLRIDKIIVIRVPYSDVTSLSFVRQELGHSELRIFVKITRGAVPGNESIRLIGKLEAPESIPISVYDADTGELLF